MRWRTLNLFLLSIYLAFCGCNQSEQRRVQEFRSPDGSWMIEINSFTHGALAPSFTSIELYQRDAHRQASDEVFQVHGMCAITAKWIHSDAVEIDSLDCPFQDAHLMVIKKGPIRISYKGPSFESGFTP